MKVETKYGIDDVVYIPAKVVSYTVSRIRDGKPEIRYNIRYGIMLTRKAIPEDDDCIGADYFEIDEDDLHEYRGA